VDGNTCHLFDIWHKIVLDRYMFGHDQGSIAGELGNDSADLRIAQMLQHLTNEGDIGNGEIIIHHVEATEIDAFFPRIWPGCARSVRARHRTQ
jgi:hypothetical protein